MNICISFQSFGRLLQPGAGHFAETALPWTHGHGTLHCLLDRSHGRISGFLAHLQTDQRSSLGQIQGKIPVNEIVQVGQQTSALSSVGFVQCFELKLIFKLIANRSTLLKNN